MRSKYPILRDYTLDEVIRVLREIIRYRTNEDLIDWNNLRNIYLTGRIVAKVPTGPTDVASTDEVGDISYDGTYQYTLVDVSGTPTWDRRALDTSW